jgi:hypothetical protein
VPFVAVATSPKASQVKLDYPVPRAAASSPAHSGVSAITSHTAQHNTNRRHYYPGPHKDNRVDAMRFQRRAPDKHQAPAEARDQIITPVFPDSASRSP